MPTLPDTVLSIGGFCQPGYQVRRFTGQKPTMFDGLITPFAGLVDCIREDGARLCRRFRLTADARDVCCDAYGFAFHHEVARAGDGTAIVDNAVLDHIVSKFDYKWRQFCGLVEGAGRVLFVRLCGHAAHGQAWPYEPETQAFGSADLDALTLAIETRWPGLDYHVAFAYYPEFGTWEFDALPLRVSVHALDAGEAFSSQPGDQQWRGSDTTWNHLFRSLGVKETGNVTEGQNAVQGIRRSRHGCSHPVGDPALVATAETIGDG